MNQKTAIIAATAITAFLLVGFGLVWGRVSTPLVVEQAVPTTDPMAQMQEIINQRETAYQERIREANTRLEQANQQLQAAYQQQQALAQQLNDANARLNAPAPVEGRVMLQAPATVPVQPTAVPAPAVSDYAVSPDQAAAIAMAQTPGTQLLRQPELVNFQGVVAYEVALNVGMIYVDAYTGQMLYDGVAATLSQQNNGGGEREHEHEDHDDDEGGDHDD